MVMKVNLGKDEDAFKQYLNLMFTRKGYDTLHTYLKSLVSFYLEREEYPFFMPPVMGLPLYQYSQQVCSKADLLGRIRALSQVLGVDYIKKEDNNLLESIE